MLIVRAEIRERKMKEKVDWEVPGRWLGCLRIPSAPYIQIIGDQIRNDCW